MVNFLKYKNKKIKLRILKSRKLDFFRINPFAMVKMGAKRLVRKGFLAKGEAKPTDNPNYFVTRSLIAHWAPTRFTDGDIHVGFTITIKTVSKRANKRNLVKRRLRALVNENIRKFSVRGYDFVFTARSGILDISYEDLKNELRRILKNAEHKIWEEKHSISQNKEFESSDKIKE